MPANRSYVPNNSGFQCGRPGQNAPGNEFAEPDYNPVEVNMSGLSPMIMLLILWGGITLVLVVLLIYRSTLTMHEDDQLFLSEGETQLAQEQVELQHRMDKLQPLVRACGALSVALLVAMAGMGLYDMYKNF
jgi:hypothetical protein